MHMPNVYNNWYFESKPDETQEKENDIEDSAASLEKSTPKKSKQITLPWWCKIFAYVFAFVCMIISMFIIIMYGKQKKDNFTQS